MRRMMVILAVALCSLLVAGVTTASPLTDYSAGKVALDVNWTPSLDGDIGVDKFDGKSGNFDFGVTAGLGNKWAIQYRYANPVSKDRDFYWFPSGHVGVRTQEVNVLYQLDKNLSAFVGWHQAKITSNIGINGDNKNAWQVGLIGTTEIAKKTTLYGIVGAGNSLFSAEAGVAYAMTKDLDLNVFYRYKRMDDLKSNSMWGEHNTDVTVKGLGLGVTYKF
jgi:predicted porin